MRIVAGKFRGRKLVNSDHLKSLRPTTDKNREALFSILSSAKFIKEIGFKINDAEVLDVCCGSGAVAFEALSRGAKFATLIDNSSEHLELAKKNSALLKVGNEIEIIRADVKNLPENKKHFDLIFIDPPYAQDYSAILTNLFEKNWIQKNSLIIIEFSNLTTALPAFTHLRLLDLRNYGKTAFAFLVMQ